MALFDDDDPTSAGRARQRALRKRKARTLLASPYDKYNQMGERLMQEVQEEIKLEQRRAEAEVEAALRERGLSRQEARDAAEAAFRAEQMSFAREREQADTEREERQFERRSAEAAARLGLDRERLGLQRRESEAERAFRERQFAAEQGQGQGQGEPPEPGAEVPPAPPGPSALPGGPPPDDDGIPSTRIYGKSDAGQRSKLTDSATNLARLYQAYALFQKNPGAYGGGNAWLGAAGSVPLVGPQAKSLAGRLMSSDTRKVRNAVEEVVSSILRERAGASQTEHEFLRQQFLPNEIDSAQQVDEKIRNLLQSEITRYKALGGADDLGLPPSPTEQPDVDDIVKKYLGKPQRPDLMRSH